MLSFICQAWLAELVLGIWPSTIVFWFSLARGISRDQRRRPTGRPRKAMIQCPGTTKNKKAKYQTSIGPITLQRLPFQRAIRSGLSAYCS